MIEIKFRDDEYGSMRNNLVKAITGTPGDNEIYIEKDAANNDVILQVGISNKYDIKLDIGKMGYISNRKKMMAVFPMNKVRDKLIATKNRILDFAINHDYIFIENPLSQIYRLDDVYTKNEWLNMYKKESRISLEQFSIVIHALIDCDLIYFDEGYEQSEDCKRIFDIAVTYGKKMIVYSTKNLLNKDA